MTTKLKVHLLVLLALWSVPAFAQGAAFTYRGHLTAAGVTVNSPHDLEFRLFDTAGVGAGAQQGDTKSQAAVPVINGDFSVTLDFGAAVFDGSPRFLEIGVRAAGGAGPYTTLAPRQQVTSVPYAIHSLTAGTAQTAQTAATAATAATATTVVNGAAVQSLNNLKDSVTLAAGANVTITPSGNTLTIASTGLPSLWAAADNNAYYDAGNVGIGTSTPAHRLSLNGGPSWTANGWVGSMELPNGSALAWQANSAGQRFGLGHANTGFYLFRTASDPGTGGSPALYDFVVDDSGNVGIGVNAPTPGIRLEVAGAALLRPGNGSIQFGSPNAELGLSIIPTLGDNRADLRFDGSVLKLVASAGRTPPSPANGLAITTAGNVGIGTTTPIAKLHVENAQSGKSAVFGNETGTSGIGVYGGATAATGVGVFARNLNGVALFADGNMAQARDKAGSVKAMVYVAANGAITRCYNGVTGNAGNPCGFSIENFGGGLFGIDFGFRVDDRFVSVTSGLAEEAHAGFTVYKGPTTASVLYGYQPTFIGETRPNSIFVQQSLPSSGFGFYPASFTVIVY